MRCDGVGPCRCDNLIIESLAMEQSLSSEQLLALLEDTQASLATSFARIEAYRLQNKTLREEVSALRNHVHGEAGDSPAPVTKSVSIKFPQLNSVLSGATSSQHPISIIEDVTGKKTTANLIINRDHLDFVVPKAHIGPKDFVGITAVKAAALARKSAPSGFFCCLAAPQGDLDLSDITDVAGDGQENGPSTSGRENGRWQVMWNQDLVTKKLVFEATGATRQTLHRLTERWLGVNEHEEATGAEENGSGDIVPPKSLVMGDANLLRVPGGDPSQVLSDEHFRALASAVPPLQRFLSWQLSYSTVRHGISLSTLFRRSAGHTPTFLVVRDTAGFVFGCYSEEGWKTNPRFYGTGETFVFQLEPHRIMYPWRSLSQVKNDFFQYATLDCLAVGGLGHFAIHLDSELMRGSSSTCGTFGSPCLAGKEDFKISMVEIWQAVQ